MGHVAFLATKELKFVHLLYWHKALRLLDGLVVESYWLQSKHFKRQEGTVVPKNQMVTSSIKIMELRLTQICKEISLLFKLPHAPTKA